MESKAAFKALRQAIRQSQHIKRGQRGSFRRAALERTARAIGTRRAMKLYQAARFTVCYDPIAAQEARKVKAISEARRMSAAADREEMERDRLAGALLDRADVDFVMQDFGARLREIILELRAEPAKFIRVRFNQAAAGTADETRVTIEPTQRFHELLAAVTAGDRGLDSIN